MKAEIQRDGTIYITAETLCEAYALTYFYGEPYDGEVRCALDCSILDEEPTPGEAWDEDTESWDDSPDPWDVNDRI